MQTRGRGIKLRCRRHLSVAPLPPKHIATTNKVQPPLTLHGIKSGLRAAEVVPRYIMKEANFSISFNTRVSPLKSVLSDRSVKEERESGLKCRINVWPLNGCTMDYISFCFLSTLHSNDVICTEIVLFCPTWNKQYAEWF